MRFFAFLKKYQYSGSNWNCVTYKLEFPVFFGVQSSKFLLSYISGAVGGLSDIEVSNEAQFKSYQNQTAEDIESGRARYERYTLMFFDT